jgi:hypothetical protein
MGWVHEAIRTCRGHGPLLRGIRRERGFNKNSVAILAINHCAPRVAAIDTHEAQ